MGKKSFLSIVSLVLIAIVFVATGLNFKAEAEEKALEVQFVPTNNDGSMQAKAEPFAKYLSEKLGREVNVTLATDYSTIVQAMASGQVDIGIMPPAAYTQAREMGAAEALLTSVLGAFDDETGEPLEGETTGSFRAEILVKADSDLKDVKDLVGKNIATLNPSSASGYIYPIAELKNQGIDLVSEANLTVVNDIPSMITAILNGQQDAGFSFQGTRYVFSKAFPDNKLPEDLKVLYLSEGEIPNDAIAVQPKMDADLKEKVKQTFLEMNQSDEGKDIMALWNHLGYVEADESVYDTVVEYTKIAAE
ncbi:phosphate/phosphite/phosphonate ABC transporter substrate-binding protein [Ignavigranum ruoffiae]|uniref:phosphate/phosphite/phosphonate ABC transporter substrate-binding protein n=1 Tax=Ignavigranum ruoffiae TaxID=89093 RepID=UPI00206887A3|nr:phosphate/phosphite/phosphonate ABC transporter substrate-binding protein [Ignavigranum ruoffiae]UPQ85168.1 phosphate/phosphite/phosphonate ABC transporter substrate-binding protein [Ignavigranum ruoffiae]